jgi:hypothetical protein
MSFRISKLFVVTLLAILLGACATRQSLPELPTTLGTNGLLVARLYVLGLRSIENASIYIDGKLISSSMRDGYIAVPLEPGEHRLSQIRAAGQLISSNTYKDDSPMRMVKGGGGGGYRAPTYIYVPGSTHVVHYTTLAVDRTFTIEAGKITNLGLMVYLPVEDDPSRKKASTNASREFRVLALDNSAEINTFLETNYPELVTSIKDRNIILAPAKYLEPKNLPFLRRAIAYHESRGPNVIASANKTLIYGRAGTIVSLGKQTPETPGSNIEVLETGTLADVIGGVRNGEQFTFLTSDAKLIEWDGSKVTQTPLPYKVQPVRMDTFGDDGLIIVDNHLRILTTPGLGQKWTNNESMMYKTPSNDFRITSSSSGSYIASGSRGVPNFIYYVKAGTSAPVSIAPPVNNIGISTIDFNRMLARDAGLFIIYNKADFFFRPQASGRWESYSKPAGTCKPMKIDDDGYNLTVECDGVTYKSSNSGAKWDKPGT